MKIKIYTKVAIIKFKIKNKILKKTSGKFLDLHFSKMSLNQIKFQNLF